MLRCTAEASQHCGNSAVLRKHRRKPIHQKLGVRGGSIAGNDWLLSNVGLWLLLSIDARFFAKLANAFAHCTKYFGQLADANEHGDDHQDQDQFYRAKIKWQHVRSP